MTNKLTASLKNENALSLLFWSCESKLKDLPIVKTGTKTPAGIGSVLANTAMRNCERKYYRMGRIK